MLRFRAEPRAPLPYRRCTDEYGRNGGLPAKYAVCRMPYAVGGEPTVPDVGDQSTALISSTMKLRSMTPFDDVSEVKCMVLPFGVALFRRSRRHLRLSLGREHEWEHPPGYCVHGSHLLA